jgi:hypothetical protein
MIILLARLPSNKEQVVILVPRLIYFWGWETELLCLRRMSQREVQANVVLVANRIDPNKESLLGTVAPMPPVFLKVCCTCPSDPQRSGRYGNDKAVQTHVT